MARRHYKNKYLIKDAGESLEENFSVMAESSGIRLPSNALLPARTAGSLPVKSLIIQVKKEPNNEKELAEEFKECTQDETISDKCALEHSVTGTVELVPDLLLQPSSIKKEQMETNSDQISSNNIIRCNSLENFGLIVNVRSLNPCDFTQQPFKDSNSTADRYSKEFQSFGSSEATVTHRSTERQGILSSKLYAHDHRSTAETQSASELSLVITTDRKQCESTENKPLQNIRFKKKPLNYCTDNYTRSSNEVQKLPKTNKRYEDYASRSTEHMLKKIKTECVSLERSSISNEKEQNKIPCINIKQEPRDDFDENNTNDIQNNPNKSIIPCINIKQEPWDDFDDNNTNDIHNNPNQPIIPCSNIKQEPRDDFYDNNTNDIHNDANQPIIPCSNIKQEQLDDFEDNNINDIRNNQSVIQNTLIKQEPLDDLDADIHSKVRDFAVNTKRPVEDCNSDKADTVSQFMKKAKTDPDSVECPITYAEENQKVKNSIESFNVDPNMDVKPKNIPILFHSKAEREDKGDICNDGQLKKIKDEIDHSSALELLSVIQNSESQILVDDRCGSEQHFIEKTSTIEKAHGTENQLLFEDTCAKHCLPNERNGKVDSLNYFPKVGNTWLNTEPQEVHTPVNIRREPIDSCTTARTTNGTSAALRTIVKSTIGNETVDTSVRFTMDNEKCFNKPETSEILYSVVENLTRNKVTRKSSFITATSASKSISYAMIDAPSQSFNTDLLNLLNMVMKIRTLDVQCCLQELNEIYPPKEGLDLFFSSVPFEKVSIQHTECANFKLKTATENISHSSIEESQTIANTPYVSNSLSFNTYSKSISQKDCKLFAVKREVENISPGFGKDSEAVGNTLSISESGTYNSDIETVSSQKYCSKPLSADVLPSREELQKIITNANMLFGVRAKSLTQNLSQSENKFHEKSSVIKMETSIENEAKVSLNLKQLSKYESPNVKLDHASTDINSLQLKNQNILKHIAEEEKSRFEKSKELKCVYVEPPKEQHLNVTQKSKSHSVTQSGHHSTFTMSDKNKLKSSLSNVSCNETTGTKTGRIRSISNEVDERGTDKKTSSEKSLQFPNSRDPSVQSSYTASSASVNSELLKDLEDSKVLESNRESSKYNVQSRLKKSIKKTFTMETLRENTSIYLHKNVGKTFIETKDLSYMILEWNPSWLSTQTSFPPICDRYLRVKDSYENELDYYNTYLPLHLLSIWLKINYSWKKSTAVLDCIYEKKESKLNLTTVECSTVIHYSDIMKWPRREDIVLITSLKSDKEAKQLFGRVTMVMNKDHRPSSSSHCGKPGTLRKVKFHCLCSEAPDAQLHDYIKVQIICNLRIDLLKNDALLSNSSSEIALTPNLKKFQIQAIRLESDDSKFFQKCIGRIVESIMSSKIRMTLVDTSSSCNSISAISDIARRIWNNNSSVLICARYESFYDFAYRLNDCNLVLAVKAKDLKLPEDLKNFAVDQRIAAENRCDFFRKGAIILTVLSFIYLGEMKDKFSEEQPTCIVEDAHLCKETDTALLFYYNVKKMILMGKDEVRLGLHPILKRYGYDVSFFSRLRRVMQ